ncbi:MAG: hypothetical protein ABGZ23_28685 [Fuerstiella sp.]
MKKTTFRSVNRLTFVLVVGWIICFWPARMVRPEEGVKWMSVAALSCLLPGWIVVFLERLAIFRDDMTLMLGQIGVRFFAILVVALSVRLLHPEFGVVDFYGWLMGFYLLAMCVETVLLREKFAKSSTSPDGDVPSDSQLNKSSSGKP